MRFDLQRYVANMYQRSGARVGLELSMMDPKNWTTG